MLTGKGVNIVSFDRGFKKTCGVEIVSVDMVFTKFAVLWHTRFTKFSPNPHTLGPIWKMPITNAFGRVTLLLFIGKDIDSRNHVG